MTRPFLGVALLALVAACSAKTESPTAATSPAAAGVAPEYRSELPMKELMGHVID